MEAVANQINSGIMAQVLYTGQGEFKGAKVNFDPASFMEKAAEVSTKLYTYKQQELQRRLDEFKELTDVKMDNLILDKIQGEGFRKLEEFNSYAAKLYEKNNGMLTGREMMDITSKRKELEMWSETQSAKASAYVQQRDLLAKDAGANFDISDSTAALKKFADDPLNTDAPTLVPRYRSVDEIVAYEFNKRGNKWMDADAEEIVTEGGVQTTKKVRYRDGLITEDDRRAWLADVITHNNEMRRTLAKEFKSVIDANAEGVISEEEALDMTSGDTFEKLYALVSPRLEPFRYDAMRVQPKGATFNFGGGLSAGGYSASINTRGGANVVSFSGTKFPAVNLSVEGESRKVKVDEVSKGSLKGRMEVVIDEADMDKTPFANDFAVRQRYGVKAIKVGDMYYPAKKEEKEVTLPLTDEEEANVITQLNAAMKGEFTGLWSKAFPQAKKPTTSKAQPSSPNEEQKQGRPKF